MNKWEREVFMPQLAKKPMTDKEFDKIARPYDKHVYDNIRNAFNNIHTTVGTLDKVSKLVKNTTVNVKVECPTAQKLKSKWTRKGFLNELKTGPMSDNRFDHIMNKVASANTRKFRKEWDIQRQISNKIWARVECGKSAVSKKSSTVA